MNDAQFDRLHEKIAAHAQEVERFHHDLSDLAKQVANCDKLVRLANSSLGQIDEKIAEAIQIRAQAQQIAEDAGQRASAQAAAAASGAITDLIGTLEDATEAARKTSRSLQILQLHAGWWIAVYALITLLCCLATFAVTSWVLQGKALTPEQAQYVELGKAHEALLNNASDKELKQISAIRNRPPAKTK